MAIEGEYTSRKSAKALEAILNRAYRHKEPVTLPTPDGDLVFRIKERPINNSVYTTYMGRTLDGERLVTVRPKGEHGNGPPYILVTS